MSMVDASAWYVVQTHANGEVRAACNLVRQGFETYLPRYLKRRSHARKIERVPAPLFPRYLFVRMDVATQRWRSVCSTFGVSRLVSNGSFPEPVPARVLNALRAREDAGGYVTLDRRPKFALGEKVRVLTGVFADNLGLFDGMADRDRVAILLDLLGRKVRVVTDAESIDAA
jgi:transcriptional antiterminator RfaH